MGIIGGRLGYELLRRIAPGGVGTTRMDGSAYAGKSKLEVLLGTDFWGRIQGRTVLDFGCGTGTDAVEMAQRGARHVIGLDVQERFLAVARERAERAGVSDRCEFVTQLAKPVDVVVSLDAFEHFADPSGVLDAMAEHLTGGGRVIAAFGPTWLHPLGGHLFSVFPWAHLVFTERALIRWRADFKDDGATRFGEVAGGLNQMTIRRFVRIVEASPLEFSRLELVPIRAMRAISLPITREFTTAVVRCELVHRD